ncbi:hypothetical protein BIWAKO_00076 [Bosea sp. BIWAKO-01]|nr:hypothetical protein BIWAKO_00076 [Bosea sp. BIWAKO-01]
MSMITSAVRAKSTLSEKGWAAISDRLTNGAPVAGERNKLCKGCA